MMFLLLTLALLSFTNAQLIDIGDLLPIELSLSGGARSQLAGCVTADGLVVFAGGLGGVATAFSAAVDIVATADNGVSAGEALSLSRYGLSAATASNFSIFAGGLSAAATSSAAVDIYDATTGTWNTTNLVVARAYHCIGGTADYLYVAGGQTAVNAYTDSVEVFDAATGEIDVSLNFTLSVARAYIATATLETTVYFAGGLFNNGTDHVTANVDVYESVSGNLTVVELTQPRQQIAAIAVGTQVFFAGGASAAGVASNVVDIWDSVNGTFTTAVLSQARWGLKVVVVGDLVIFHGGYSAANAASDVIDVYNVVNQTWTVSQLARARANFASVAVDNKVYIAGGVSAGLLSIIGVTGEGSLEILDFDLSPNSTGTPTPTPTESVNLTTTVVTFLNARAQLAATVNGAGQLLIGGGLGASVVFNAISAIDIANPVDATVNLAQVLGVARAGLRAETTANVSVFAGGALLSLLPQTSVDVYFAVNDSWISASLQTARVFHASAVVGTKIYFAGGQSTALAFTNSIEVYDTETGRWATLSATLSVARGYLTASVVGNKIVFAGGRSGLVATATVSNVVDILDTDTNTTTTAQLSVARAELASAVVGDLILFGGGVEAGLTASVVVDIWNSTSGVFLAATEALSVGRWALQAVTVGTDVFFVGGFDGTDAFATVDIWSSVELTWTVKQLTFPRYNFAATVDVEGNAYFCGGQDASLSFLASVEIYAGGSSSDTPTPTPGDETPTPTPEVTPTPTPGQTPTPTPGGVDKCAICQNTFDSAKDSWTPVLSTDFTVQCGAWDDLLTCLADCNSDNNADQTATDLCKQTGTIQDFCVCGRSDFNFNVDAVLAFIDTNNDVFVTRFDDNLPGIVKNPASGTGTVITVDQSAKTFRASFTYEDTATVTPGNTAVTVDLIAAAWSLDLGLYFNANPVNFVVSRSKKRAEQQASLSVVVADNDGQSSGVTQLSISLAFVVVTCLLHVLF